MKKGSKFVDAVVCINIFIQSVDPSSPFEYNVVSVVRYVLMSLFSSQKIGRHLGDSVVLLCT